MSRSHTAPRSQALGEFFKQRFVVVFLFIFFPVSAAQDTEMRVKITSGKTGIYTGKLNQQQSEGEPGLGGM